MKKTIYLIGIAASIMGGITSCTLDAKDYVTKSSENFPATTEDATQALAGIYQNLNQVSATPECSFLYAAMLASDDCLGGGGPNDLHMQSLDMLMNSKQDMTQQFWKDRYQGINRANSLLDGIGNIELANPTRTRSREKRIPSRFLLLRAGLHVRTRPSDNHLAIRRAKPTNRS